VRRRRKAGWARLGSGKEMENDGPSMRKRKKGKTKETAKRGSRNVGLA